jgi:hypothetical protein
MNKFKMIGILSLFLLGCSTQEIHVRFLESGFTRGQMQKKSLRIVPPANVEVLAFNEAFDRMFHGRQAYINYMAAALKSQLDTLGVYGAVTIDSTTANSDYIVNVKSVKIANRVDLAGSAPSAGGTPAGAGTNHTVVGIQCELLESATMKKVLDVEITAEESVVLVFTGSAIRAATNKVIKDFAEYLNKNL